MQSSESSKRGIRIYNPEGIARPVAQYHNVATAGGMVFVAGQVALDADGNIVGKDDFEAQCRQTYRNIEIALNSAGAGWGNVVRFTTYLVHSQDIERLWHYREREFPKMFPDRRYPPNALLIIDRLVLEPLLIEVEATAVL